MKRTTAARLTPVPPRDGVEPFDLVVSADRRRFAYGEGSATTRRLVVVDGMAVRAIR